VNVVSRGEPRTVSEKEVSHNLDPHEVDADKATGPVEKLEDIQVSEVDAKRYLKLG